MAQSCDYGNHLKGYYQHGLLARHAWMKTAPASKPKCQCACTLDNHSWQTVSGKSLPLKRAFINQGATLGPQMRWHLAKYGCRVHGCI